MRRRFDRVVSATHGAFASACTSTYACAESCVQTVKNVPRLDVRAATAQGAIWFNATLGSADFALQLSGWMRDALACGASTAYDRAMDAVYAETYIGGAYHRLFDGGHTLFGAWEAIQKANIDDTFLERIQGYFLALMKDFVTPMGLPFVTIPKEGFDAAADVLFEHLGVSKAWLVDAASLTATELLGAVIGVVSVALNWSNDDIRRFSSLIGSLGLSSIASTNPMLAIVTLVALARAYQQAAHGGERGALAKGVARGALGAGASMAVASLAPGAWIGLIAIVCVGVVSNKAFDKGEQMLGDVDWAALAQRAQAYLAYGRRRAPRNECSPPADDSMLDDIDGAALA